MKQTAFQYSNEWWTLVFSPESTDRQMSIKLQTPITWMKCNQGALHEFALHIYLATCWLAWHVHVDWPVAPMAGHAMNNVTNLIITSTKNHFGMLHIDRTYKCLLIEIMKSCTSIWTQSDCQWWVPHHTAELKEHYHVAEFEIFVCI